MKKRLTLLMSIVAVGIIVFSAGSDSKTLAAVPNVNAVMSQYASGTWSNGASQLETAQSVSGDGSEVVFESEASNLVSSDTNGVQDIFVRNTQTGTTTLVDVSTGGAQANAYAAYPSISYDGRFVTFASAATNLVSGVTDGHKHIYIRDLVNQTTSVVDTSATGTVGNSDAITNDVNADGRYVVFSSSANNLVSGVSTSSGQIYIKDMDSGAIQALALTSGGSAGNGPSYVPSISCDGNTVAFLSQATNLTASAPGGSGRWDLFVDKIGMNGSNELSAPTASSDGGVNNGDWPQVSCNGNIVLFASSSTNIVSPSVTSGYNNAYEYNRLTGNMTLVSLGNGGAQANSNEQGKQLQASMSDDGRYVVFNSYATNVDTSYSSGWETGTGSDLYVRDVKKGTSELVTIDHDGHRSGKGIGVPSISPDGSFVAFQYPTPGTSYIDNALSSITTGGSSSVRDVYESETGY